MKLSEVKNILREVPDVRFVLENGEAVPEHFHVTEVGVIFKHFIDCGGVVRQEKRVGFQLWNANDFNHRLKPVKLLSIITLSEDKLNLPDAEIEVEYQRDTIGKFGLGFDGSNFVLKGLTTTCLASDSCGIPAEQLPENAGQENVASSKGCAPGSGCC
jgi:hypothetical protein